MINKTCKTTPKRTIIYALIAGVLTGLTSLQAQVNAAIYKADSNKRINIEISQVGVNRIEVKKDRIAKVIGNINKPSTVLIDFPILNTSIIIQSIKIMHNRNFRKFYFLCTCILNK